MQRNGASRTKLRDRADGSRRGGVLVMALVLAMLLGVSLSVLMLSVRQKVSRTAQQQWNAQAELAAIAVATAPEPPGVLVVDDPNAPEWAGATLVVRADRVELRKANRILAAAPFGLGQSEVVPAGQSAATPSEPQRQKDEVNE